LLQIDDLHLDYDRKQVLKGVSLELSKGEILAIVGESGAGKSTLGLCIGGLVGRSDKAAGRSQNAGKAQGRILFHDRDILRMPEEELRQIRWNQISFVFQNIARVFNPVMPIIDQIAEPVWTHGLGDRQQGYARARSTMEQTGFPLDKSQSYPHQLSGGEIQRALIAMALVNDPELLILDEPTASLDPITRREVVHLLKKCAENSAVLLITHDLSVASLLSNRTAVLYKGRILEEGPTEKVMQTPNHPYMRALLRAYPHMSTSKDIQSIKDAPQDDDGQGCPFRPRCTQAISVCAQSVPVLTSFGIGLQPTQGQDDEKIKFSKVACHRGGVVPYLVAHHLHKKYGKGFCLEDTSFIVFEGETVALVGQSGSGKSTIAKLIMGMETIDKGKILLEEEKVLFPRDKDFYNKVQMIFQNPYDAVNLGMTVQEIIMEPLRIQKIGSKQERQQKATQALFEVGLPNTIHFMESYPDMLSGGELQRLSIARSLILDPKLLIADEPTSALDALVQAKIVKLFMDIQERRGLGMLFITHDIALARKIADRIIVIEKGRVVEQGLSWEITTRPKHAYTRKLLEAASDCVSI